MPALSPIAAIAIAALLFTVALIAFIGALYSERNGESADFIGFGLITVLFSFAGCATVVIYA